MQIADRIEEGQDHQPERVVGDGEQQEEWHRGMIAEDRAADNVAERDVGRARNRPAACEDRFVRPG